MKRFTPFLEVIVVESKFRFFGLARNLIRHLISPNQVDLSYSSRTSFPAQQKFDNVMARLKFELADYAIRVRYLIFYAIDRMGLLSIF